MNVIIDTWKKLESVEKEHQLFDDYKKAREKYLDGVKQVTQGKKTETKLQHLFDAEQKAFSTYCLHRTPS